MNRSATIVHTGATNTEPGSGRVCVKIQRSYKRTAQATLTCKPPFLTCKLPYRFWVLTHPQWQPSVKAAWKNAAQQNQKLRLPSASAFSFLFRSVLSALICGYYISHVAVVASDDRKRFAALALAFETSVSRSRGGAFVTSDRRSSCAACATCSTARLKASSLAFEGRVKPLSFRTNCRDDARISSSVAGGLKLCRVLMFRHIVLIFLLTLESALHASVASHDRRSDT